MSNVLISVIVTTYNQEKFIGKALDGILNQETQYNYEILIGDDNSQDRTNSILEKYKNIYADKITIYRSSSNMGESENTVNLIKKCRGEYIAVCEGDDYWCDKSKLEKQISFLEKHNEFIGTAHNVYCVDENGRRISNRKSDFPYRQSFIYGRDNVLKYEELGQMSSYVYRNIWSKWSDEQLDMFRKCRVNTDVKLNMTLGILGDVYFFEDVMSCRRKVYSGEGWTATISGKNMSYISFRNCIYVRDYLKERFDVNIHMDWHMFQYKWNSLEELRRKKTKENIEIVYEIYKEDNANFWDFVIEYLGVSLFQKIFGYRAQKYLRVYDAVRKYGFYDSIRYWRLPEKRCIYVQNTKVACSSIKASMFDVGRIEDYESIHKNLQCLELRKKKGELLTEEYKNDFVFTFVRNPFERIVSCYFNKFVMDEKLGKDNYFKDYFISEVHKASNFDEFVKKIFFIPDIIADSHFRSQVCITKGKKNGCDLNFVGKYENLKDDYTKISNKFGLSELEWKNKSDKYDWRDYYNFLTLVLVSIRYRKDIRKFGYQNKVRELFVFLVKRQIQRWNK